MDLDLLSPAAPAQVRVLLLPVGKITRTRFLEFLDRLKPYQEIQLRDVSPDGRPNKNTFTPQGFPSGRVMYNFSTSLAPSTHARLFPFESFRQPLMVIGIADALQNLDEGNHITKDSQHNDRYTLLSQELVRLRHELPRALVHRLMVFDHSIVSGFPKMLGRDILTVPPVDESKVTTIKMLMCDLTTVFLGEMSDFARYLDGLSTIESPGPANTPSDDEQSYLDDWGRTRSDIYLDSSVHRQSSRSRSGSAQRRPQHDHRVSLPLHLMSARDASPSRQTDHRPTSRTRTPPTSIAGDKVASPPRATWSAVNGEAHPPNRDRVSVSGIPTSSVGERERNKGKGRLGIVIGTLYLQAGRWVDALRELTEGTGISKSQSDHLWHAKGLENILATLLMMAYAGLDFQIPHICFPLHEKSSSSRSTAHSTPSTSVDHIAASNPPGAPNPVMALQNLANSIPDLSNLVLSLYSRVIDTLPHIAFSEAVIRASRMLTVLHLSDGALTASSLDHVVRHTFIGHDTKVGSTRYGVRPSRSEITSILYRAFPGESSQSSNFPVIDRILVLSGMCSVLSMLGLRRKMAFIMKELVSVLVPGLIQARKRGAAELGVHPAAGITALNAVTQGKSNAGAFDLGDDIETGTTQFLDALCRIYGASGPDGYLSDGPAKMSLPSPIADNIAPQTQKYSDEAVISSILQYSAFRSFGNMSLKFQILRLCVNLCEALPDFTGVLRFTSDILRTAGNGSAAKADGSGVFISLEPEEQVRLASNISRTVAVAKRLGLQDVEAEYWDDFLLRNVEVVDPSLWSQIIPHLPKELEGVGTTQSEKSPFIFNPFAKQPGAKTIVKYLVVGQASEIKLTLQNPYDFELEIEYLRLETEGVELDSLHRRALVGPFRSQAIYIWVTPRSQGPLSIVGGVFKIKGCRERRFPILVETWSPERELKIKTIGLSAFQAKRRPLSAAFESKAAQPGQAEPRPTKLEFTVITEQPVVAVKSTGLPQSSLMVLEGERKRFKISLENLSAHTPADLFLLTFFDSTSAPTQGAMKRKDITPAELYELEWAYSRKPAFQWIDSDSQSQHVSPGEATSVEIEVLGKPGLTEGNVQIDYSYLGKKQENFHEKFFTRQVSVPISVTVNASIELIRTDVLPLFEGLYDLLRNLETDEETARALYEGYQYTEQCLQEKCLMLLDLRNAWPSAMDVGISYGGKPVTSDISRKGTSRNGVQQQDKTLQPGQTHRFVLVLPRISLSNPFAPIPTLHPANERQFVVSGDKMSPELERANREAFWIREEILKSLRGTWKEEGTTRKGDIEMRNIRLSPRMIEAVKLEEVGIDMTVVGPQCQDSGKTSCQGGAPRFSIPVDDFVLMKTRVTNRTQKSIKPVLRLQPSLRNQSHNFALDISKCFAWNGLLQQPLEAIQPGETTESHLSFCVFSSGEYEIGASIEEIHPWQSNDPDERTGSTGSDMAMIAVMNEEPDRRLFHARAGCVIVAHDQMNEV